MNSLDVEGVYVFVKERFDERLAYNFKDEQIDGRNLMLLSRSPDCLALLNRLGMRRITDILKFQELMGTLRSDISCSFVPALSVSVSTGSAIPKRITSSSASKTAASPIATSKTNSSDTGGNRYLDVNAFSPRTESVHSTSQPSFERQQSPNNPSSIISSVYASNQEEVTGKTLVNWQQKVLRSEVHRRWMDHELPTFRRMDTDNNRELDVFVEDLMNISVLATMGKELVRRKVILIIRERRKYVKHKFQESEEVDEQNATRSPPSFVYHGEENHHRGEERTSRSTGGRGGGGEQRNGDSSSFAHGEGDTKGDFALVFRGVPEDHQNEQGFDGEFEETDPVPKKKKL